MFLARVSPTFRTAFGCAGKQWLTLKDAQLSFLRPYPHLLCATPGFCIQKVREMNSGQMSSREEAKRLTVKMKEASTAADFLDVLDDVVDRRVFDTYHAGAAYHSMAKWQKQGGLQVSGKTEPLLCRLNDRVQSLMANGQLDARKLANILWSLAHLADVLPNFSAVVRATVAQVPSKVQNMNAQDVSNSLWAAATLQEIAPDVMKIVPILVTQVASTVKEMNEQNLSNSLWAAARLQETSPVVLKMVPTLLAQVPLKAKAMNAQGTATCLSAATHLREKMPDVLKVVPVLLDQATVNMKEMQGDNLRLALPTIIWACARLGVRKDDMFVEAFELLGSKRTYSSLSDWGVCALVWSVETLDLKNRFIEFHQKLKKELRKRHLSKVDVQRSQYGPTSFRDKIRPELNFLKQQD